MIDEFLEQKKLAVVGVSRKKNKFGNVIYRELKKKGFQVYPINPNTDIVEGDICYPDLFSLPEKVDGAVVNVPPAQTEKIVKEIKEAGITKVWLQQGSQSDDSIKYCERNEIECVSNECILMFAEPAGFIHRAHRWVWGALGKLPL
ncbi:MAG: CoA-binding protein [Ignavibacteria bacterium]|nr:CoA-binding protein [Ignavibacteria bacterium]MBT8380730.1 CoA-binding protein [Ignavibacteria bacterium]MBT8390467.1 CoA-binding protein [Ignavibacteria bacterium]NNJ52907.1 CoA-binding protein [Ignavibacteriaceae bacterium]NNL20068.1 CoA-binding protein [Ignavibacteriaceae bacterium]